MIISMDFLFKLIKDTKPGAGRKVYLIEANLKSFKPVVIK
jgi:hypothetical protein